jgi:hypothetical protein
MSQQRFGFAPLVAKRIVTRKIPSMLFVGGLALASACNSDQKEKSASDAKADASEEKDAPAAKVAECPAGEQADKDKTFCIKVPPGYTMEDPRENPPNVDVNLKATDPDAAYLRVWHRPDENGGDHEAAKGNMETESKAEYNKVEDKGELDGGRGVYMIWTQEGSIHKLWVAVRGNKRSLTCDASAYDPQKIPQAVIDACKSLKPFPSG